MIEIRCGHCNKLIMFAHLARGSWFVARCPRCSWWVTPEATVQVKPLDKITVTVAMY